MSVTGLPPVYLSDCLLVCLSVSQSVCLSVGLSFSLPVFLLALQTGLKQGPLLLCANVGLFIISVYPPASLSFFTCSTRTAICLSVCLFVNCYLKLPLNGLYVLPVSAFAILINYLNQSWRNGLIYQSSVPLASLQVVMCRF